MTTDEIKALEEWPQILDCLNKAAADLKKQFPGTKVDLVTQKTKFILMVDNEAVLEITGDDLSKLKP